MNDCGVGYSNYRVRSVDSSNLFPDSSGAELTDVAETGREPGFNWSKEATTNKNEGFIIDPPKFTTIVQSQASGGKDAIYTDENLEYLFNLTPKEMKELRGKKNYTDFELRKYSCGHFGTSPAINFIYAHLNDFYRKNKYFCKANR